MQKKYLKNSIISFILIVSTISMPLGFIPKKAEAQSISGHSFSISSLPQCRDTSLTTKLLFTGTVAALGNAIQGGNAKTMILSGGLAAGTEYLIDSITPKVEDIIKNNTSLSDSVNVNIEGTAAADNIRDTKKLAQDTKKDISALKDNSTCTAAIGRIVTKMLLQKITVSTVNWIKSGFNGSPAFIQDPTKFFGDIAKNEVLQFGTEITASGSPFGKEWLKNTANAFNSKFQDNATYSLDKLIQDTNPEYSASTFQQDFSQGGWDAWTAMTQSPANNPLGFKLMADNELQKRLQGTVQSTADKYHDALSQANGFLGDQRCVDPQGVTKEENQKALTERSNHPNTGGSEATYNEKTGEAYLPYMYIYRLCKQWKYVTPGSMIADAATSTMTTTKDSLLSAQDLNDAIEAVTNALLAQFSSSLMEKGFSEINTDDLTGSSSDTLNNNTIRTQTEQDFSPAQLTTSWLSVNPDFNIRTDLTQALIDEQRTYSDKLTQQNKELMSTTDGNNYKLDDKTGISNAYGLIPAIYQLDYCIPGPHPGWEGDSQKVLSAALNKVVPETKEDLKDKNMDAILGTITSIAPMAAGAIAGLTLAAPVAALLGVGTAAATGAAVGSAVPVVGTIIGAVVGVAVGYIASLINSPDDSEKLRGYYATAVYVFTGVMPDYENGNDSTAINTESYGGFVNGMNTILSRYAEIINKTYFSGPGILPSVTTEAITDYNQLPGYAQMIVDNQNKISSLKNVINTLSDIKKSVDDLNETYSNGGDDYETALKTQINKFGNISAEMVNGDDIASVDSLTKQIIDKKDYVYKTLLKGPSGCEAFLQNPDNIKNFPSAGTAVSGRDWKNYNINSVKRMTYPFSILYDYNNEKYTKEGSMLPDPWNSGDKNTTPKNEYDVFGPGFLSFVFFSAGHVSGLDYIEVRGQERLKFAEDIFGVKSDSKYRYISVGSRKTDGDARGGPFESMIGVY